MKSVNTLIIAGFVLFLTTGIVGAVELDDLEVTVRVVESDDDIKEVEHELHLPDSVREDHDREGRDGDHHGSDGRDDDMHDDHDGDREELEDDRDDHEEVHEEGHEDSHEGSEGSEGGSSDD